jgi:hypothetical protein
MMKSGEVGTAMGWRLILVGALANCAFKVAAVAAMGHPRLTARLAGMFAIAIAGGVAILFLWPERVT